MKKWVIALLLLFVFINPSPIKSDDEIGINIYQQVRNLSIPLNRDSFINLIKESKPSVVYTTTKDSWGNILGLGTGFIIEDEGIWIITNRHVVENAGEIEIEITIANQTQRVKAEIAYLSERTDIAILKIENAEISRQAKPLKWGDSDCVHEGELVLAIGNPYGFAGTSSVGIISCIKEKNTFEIEPGRWFPHKLFQIDMAINPGNSGSPLLDINGDVIGVVFSMIREAQGMAFAIPINVVKEEILEMKTKQKEQEEKLSQSAIG